MKKEEILLGIDWGESAIGLAFSRAGLVIPLKVTSGKSLDTALGEISRIALESKVTRLVVGLPLTYDDKETAQARKVRAFVKRLKMRLKLPVEFVSEYESTKNALVSALDLGVSKKRRRVIDNISAALILKSYNSSVNPPTLE